MKALITVPAHFDGNSIVLDTSIILKQNDKLLITVLSTGIRPEEDDDWFELSSTSLNKAYAEDEPEYPLSLIKEPNPDYQK